jgi:hypothetical protein
MRNRVPVPASERPPLPAFASVPRRYRQDGWTPERPKPGCGVAKATQRGSRVTDKYLIPVEYARKWRGLTDRLCPCLRKARRTSRDGCEGRMRRGRWHGGRR